MLHTVFLLGSFHAAKPQKTPADWFFSPIYCWNHNNSIVLFSLESQDSE